MTSNSWNFRNSWKWRQILRIFEFLERTKTFIRFFDFVLREHKLIAGRLKNFSRNFSWKWCQILEIINLSENNDEYCGRNFYAKLWYFILEEYNLKENFFYTYLTSYLPFAPASFFKDFNHFFFSQFT